MTSSMASCHFNKWDTQFLSFIQRQNICCDNCSAWIIGVNIPSHFSSSLTSRHTPPDYPIYSKNGISSSLCLDSVFTSLIGCFKHHLFFSVDLRLNYLFFIFGAEKPQEFHLFLWLGYQCYDRCTPFSVIFLFNRSFLL